MLSAVRLQSCSDMKAADRGRHVHSQVGAEMDILAMVLQWAKRSCLPSAALDAVLPYVRFPLMTPHQLQVGCRQW